MSRSQTSSGRVPARCATRAHEAADALEDAPDREFPREAVRERLEALEGALGPVERRLRRPSPPRADGAAPWALWLALGARRGRRRDRARGGHRRRRRRRRVAPTATRGDQEDVVPIRLTPGGGSKRDAG